MDNSIRPDHTIIITGGGGYLGSKLAEKLITLKCTIYLLDISFNTLSEKLSDTNRNVHCHYLDLIDGDSLKGFFVKVRPHHIFHFASIIDRSRDFSIFEKLYNVNVKGTFNLLEGLLHIPYLNFCFASTSEVYGEWNEKPFQEDDPLNPMSPYSLTKFYSENLITLYSKINHKPYKILRIFNFFGIDMPSTTFMGQMVESYLNDNIFVMTKGEQARDFLPISDLLDQIVYVNQSNTASGVINICSGISFKLIDIVKAFQKSVKFKFEYKAELPYRNNEVWETKGNNNKISLLGYKTRELSINLLLNGCSNI